MKKVNRNESEYIRKCKDFPSTAAKVFYKKAARRARRLFYKQLNYYKQG